MDKPTPSTPPGCADSGRGHYDPCECGPIQTVKDSLTVSTRQPYPGEIDEWHRLEHEKSNPSPKALEGEPEELVRLLSDAMLQLWANPPYVNTVANIESRAKDFLETSGLRARLSSMGEMERALGPDAAGRTFDELLAMAADMLEGYGGGPVADCLRIKSAELSALSSPKTLVHGLSPNAVILSSMREAQAVVLGWLLPDSTVKAEDAMAALLPILDNKTLVLAMREVEEGGK